MGSEVQAALGLAGVEDSQCVLLSVAAAAEWARRGTPPPVDMVHQMAAAMRSEQLEGVRGLEKELGVGWEHKTRTCDYVTVEEEGLREARHDISNPHHSKTVSCF